MRAHFMISSSATNPKMVQNMRLLDLNFPHCPKRDTFSIIVLHQLMNQQDLICNVSWMQAFYMSYFYQFKQNFLLHYMCPELRLPKMCLRRARVQNIIPFLLINNNNNNSQCGSRFRGVSFPSSLSNT